MMRRILPNNFVLGILLLLLIIVAITTSTTPAGFHPLHPHTAKWFLAKEVITGELEPVANSSINDDRLYIGRVQVFDGVIPGKVEYTGKSLWFPLNGVEHERNNDDFEILVYNHGELTWAKMTTTGNNKDDELPQDMVQGGCHPTSKEPLYICRAFHQLVLTPGVIKRSDKICNIPYGFVEHHYDSYEVLVTSSSAEVTYESGLEGRCGEGDDLIVEENMNSSSSGAAHHPWILVVAIIISVFLCGGILGGILYLKYEILPWQFFNNKTRL